MSVTHQAKSGLTLTGAEYEAADHHVVALTEAEIPVEIARTTDVTAAVDALVAAAPGALDTLNELAAALGDDAAFSTTVTNALAGKQPLDSDLTAIAALTTTAFGRGLLELANQAALLSAAGAAASGHDHTGTYQPLDSDLTAIAALTTTAFGRGLLELANQAALLSAAGAAASSHSHAGEDITSGTVADGRVASTLARDSEVTSAVSDHAAAADPHAGYRLESADHTHASSGLQGGTVAHSALTGIGADDHHARNHDHSAAGDGTALHPASVSTGPAPATTGRINLSQGSLEGIWARNAADSGDVGLLAINGSDESELRAAARFHANAWNHIRASGAATGNDVVIEAIGNDTDVDIDIRSQASGLVRINGTQAATTTTVSTAVSTHEGAADPHPGYMTSAETTTAITGTKIDDLTAGDDNTDLNASTSKHGLMQKYPGGTTTFLRADGSFATPTAEASVAFTEFTKDLGVADRAGRFDITGLSGLTPDKPVMVMQTAAAISSKGNARDEPEMDQIQVTGYVVDATTIRCYWQAESVVVGTYAFAYLVGA